MTGDRPLPPGPPPPDPAGADTVEDFVRALAELRKWAGEPSLSRLRQLGGRTESPEGAAIDLLPKSTVSHTLRQTGRLPRWEFVRAFVTACLRYCDHPAERIPGELERWRAARTALAAPVPVPAEPDAAPAEAAVPAAGRRPASDPAVELLARRVAKEEDRARKGLLGGYSLAPVSFGGGENSGENGGEGVEEIGAFFAGLSPRRLLVVGPSGAGKTVLAIELVLQLVEPFLAAGTPAGDRSMVPVRLNAARWRSGKAFEPWLAEQLVQNHGLADRDAARLVRDRRVLPVVDGLDELDPDPSTGPPRRAMALLAELNRYSDISGRRPGAAVVTCRSDRYAQLAGARAGLDNSTRVDLHGLTKEQIGSYLRTRWPDGHGCAPHRDGVRAALHGASGEAVHSALATPWRLLLTATAIESGTDPEELLRADPDADPGAEAGRIARKLLDAYVPAAAGLTPRSGHGAGYSPEQVRAWLVHLAAHLRRQAVHAAADRSPPGLTATDLVPHLLWPIGGRRRIRLLHGLCCLILAVAAMAAFWVGSGVDRPGDLLGGPAPGQVLTLALMAGWVAIATALSLSPWPAAAGGRTNVPGRRRAAGGLIGAVAAAPAGVLGGLCGLALTGGRAFGPGFAVAAGALGGAALGAVIGLTAAGRRRAERPTVAQAARADPLSLLGFGLCGALTGLPPLRLSDAGPVPLVAGLAGAFALAVALGVAFRIATGGWSKDADLAHPREALHRDPAIGVAFGLTGGVAAFLVFIIDQDLPVALASAVTGGVAFGLSFGAIAWTRTMIGLLVTAARGLLPLRLWTFLDWACEAHLLRVSGATYQFRHRELQDFLTPPEDTAVAPRTGPLA
ncbi:NACHT domain-containing protein [Spirillospora sp. NPDC029432]|uniref:NACHT domain-containing protein n=1 Tax=Spirillospora sp. NPDC029432 TaxID=3154599 RepID=UPI0034555C3C